MGVIDGGRLAVETEVRGERRLEAGLALLAFQRLKQRGFFATDVGASAHGRVQVEIDAGAQQILAEQASRVGFLERPLETGHRLGEEFATNVVVAHRGTHAIATDGHALDDRVRVVTEDVTVVAGARLGFVRIAHRILLAGSIAGHEAPLQAGGEARATTATQTGSLQLLDNLLGRSFLAQDFFPSLVTTNLAIGFQFPATLQRERLEHHLVQRIFAEGSRHAGSLTGRHREPDRPSQASGFREKRGRPSSWARCCKRPGIPLPASGRTCHRACFRPS